MPTFILLVGLAAELYFLLGDLSSGRSPSSSNSPAAPPIGELVTRQNSVKVQNEGELVWEDTENKQTLYRRQSLLTLEDSRAEVAFLDGTGLMIDEKSLILLEKTPGDGVGGYNRIVVRLLHGTLHKSAPRKTSDVLRRVSAKTPEIEVDTGDSRIELSPASELTISARPENPEGASVTVQSGEVKVNSPHGELVVKPGEQASLPKIGSAAAPIAHKLPFSLLSPSPSQTIQALAGKQPVRFRWNATREAIEGHPQEIEVSRDPEFKSGVIKTRIPAAEPPLEYVEVNLPLPSQDTTAQWHWRVHAVPLGATPAAASETSSFWVRPLTVPQLRYPVDHAQAAAESTIDFSWEPFETATGYELEIQGRAPIQSSDSFARVQQFSPGTTSWRVRARLQDGTESEWSVSSELVIRAIPVATPTVTATAVAATPSAIPESQIAPPPPTELGEPEIRQAPPEPKHTSLWDWLIAPAFAEEEQKGPWVVHLKWRAVTGVEKYKIQVSRDPHFKDVVAESETNAAEWDWGFKPGMQNKKGRAYFRVASVSKSGVTGVFSHAKPIKIPKSILVSAKVAAPVKVGEETYPAQDLSSDAEAVGSADAAARGNLEMAKALPPSTVAVAKHTVQPPAFFTPQKVLPPPVKVASTPPSPPAQAHEPSHEASHENSHESVAKIPASSEKPSWTWAGQVALDAGYGSVSQSSASPQIASVGVQSPYLQQKISIAAELSHEGDVASAARAWRGELQLSFAGFSAPDNPPNPGQSSFNALAFRLDLQHDWAKSAGSWNLYFGGTLDRSFRWVPTGDGLSVDSQAALSLGPSARAVRTYHYTGSLFSTKEAGIALDLPITGLLTTAQWGPELRIWGEWNLASLKEKSVSLGLRAEAESGYLRWGSPNGTATFAWTFWLAPALSF